VEEEGVLSCAGISGAAYPFLVAVLRRLFPNKPIVLVTDGLKAQETIHQDLSTWLGLMHVAGGGSPEKTTLRHSTFEKSHLPVGETRFAQHSAPLFYPGWEVLPHESRLPHVDVISERLETLITLMTSKVQSPKSKVETNLAFEAQSKIENQKSKIAPAPVVVTTLTALLQRTFSSELLQKRSLTVKRGDRIDPLDLVEWLEEQGYEPEAQVTQKGELALRGGILDFYPPTSPWPVRLEFFGDELESLRYFDPLTQISREESSSVTISPAGELGILKRQRNQGIEHGELQAGPAEFGTLLDYLPAGSLFILGEPEMLNERAEEYAAQIPTRDAFYIGWEEFQTQAAAKGMVLLGISEAEPVTQNGDSDADVQDSAHRLPHFESLDAFRPLTDRPPEPQVAETQRREFFSQLHRWIRQGYAVHVFCNNDGERQRFSEIWQEYGFQEVQSPKSKVQSLEESKVQGPKFKVVDHSTKEGQQFEADNAHSNLRSESSVPESQLWTLDFGLWTHLGPLSRGFLSNDAKLVVVTDAEIFGRYKVQRPRRLKSPHAQATRSALDIDFTDLEEGDYVVHVQHGIGRYFGLQVLPIGAGTKPTERAASTAKEGQECLVIEYAPSDPDQPAPKLYVPVTEAHLVSKYVGAGKARPPLNTLGGSRWAKAKAQAERAVRDVASDLLTIQAARESQAGHAFAADVPWQREFEGAFLFEETPDQMRAILETKADMERPKPMDRLICGDVGFGKTEVGIRAAFKAVMDGRQVAVLVPTTVLAQQHYNTFRERMADYPVRIELLSRFLTRGAQQRVVKDLASGAVDIVIGTHRLLQNDIAFKELGLVVIDEEQRFGVMHKEKFKMLRKLVDVLTLSATPIPRTLYLALTGARDMSTIQTPPHDRLPVETIVTQYDERVIRDAIQRELNRSGQVFFLHNRVMTIETMAQKLRVLVPHARIVVGHGQMHSDDLEEVMTQFVNGEADVLLSTTIIESGLDIPNANTIIIDRADRFGLSDLYQLRGRVGRYKHQAYAYLLLPRHAGLLTDVRKRLSAIRQYSTLGSGFKIAMRDLEIRGAGNLLGAEQSGHITAVGFELYCQLLKQSVSSLKGETVKLRIEVQVRLDFLALNPTDEANTTGKQETRNTEHGTRNTHPAAVQSASASLPFKYISDARQRIEFYRKIAQLSDKASLQSLQKELRDRFGPLPRAVELLLQVADLKMLASERDISAIEVQEDRLMLTRNKDYIMVGSKFPRLTRKEPGPRLKEIRKLLLAL
jgi:transcription-repair coupling factor (superfamily II helicase)